MIVEIGNPTNDCGNRSFNTGLRFAGLPPVNDELNRSNLLIDKALEYGLTVHSEGVYHTQANQPVMVIYKTQEPDTCHCAFASDIAPWAGMDVYAVITGWGRLAQQVRDKSG